MTSCSLDKLPNRHGNRSLGAGDKDSGPASNPQPQALIVEVRGVQVVAVKSAAERRVSSDQHPTSSLLLTL